MKFNLFRLLDNKSAVLQENATELKGRDIRVLDIRRCSQTKAIWVRIALCPLNQLVVSSGVPLIRRGDRQGIAVLMSSKKNNTRENTSENN